MHAHGFHVSEEGHVVNILAPVDITGGVQSDVFDMGKHAHASIILQVGVSAAAFTAIIVEACDDFVPTTPTAIPFRLYPQETANGDVMQVAEEVSAAGRAPSANDGIFYVIEIDAAQLPQGSPKVRLNLTNGANSVIASAVAILSGSSYAEEGSATVIA